MSTRSFIAAAAAALSLSVIAAAPASAETVGSFDAPLLTSTGTSQLTRFPTTAELTCSDTACTSGIFAKPVWMWNEYSTDRIMRDSGYTQVPEFRRGVGASWSDDSVQGDDIAVLSLIVGEYASGSDLVQVAKTIAAKTDTVLSLRQVDGSDVWAGETVNASDSQNIYAGTGFKSAYVLSDTALYRAGCQLGGAQVTASTCTLDNLSKVAIQFARRAESPVVGQADINSLMPESFPAGMRPLILTSVTGQQAWGSSVSNPVLLAQLSKKPSAVTQFTIAGAPRMSVDVTFGALDKAAQAKEYISRKCISDSTTRDCVTTKLPGGIGYKVNIFDRGTKNAFPSLNFRGAGNGRLILMSCSKRRNSAGGMTAKDVRLCTTAAKELLKATVK